jgi:hypothetical protein
LRQCKPADRRGTSRKPASRTGDIRPRVYTTWRASGAQRKALLMSRIRPPCALRWLAMPTISMQAAARPGRAAARG